MMAADPKIIDLLNAKKEGDAPFASLEFFPPRTDDGVQVCFCIFVFFVLILFLFGEEKRKENDDVDILRVDNNCILPICDSSNFNIYIYI
jgi:hypothetical protein